MKFLNNLRVGHRLGIGFGICGALILSIALVSSIGVREIDDQIDIVVKDRYAKVQMANQVLRAVNQQARSARNALIVAEDKRAAEIANADKQGAVLTQMYERLGPMLTNAQDKAMFDELVKRRQAYRVPLAQFSQEVEDGRMEEARTTLLEKVRAPQLAYMKALDDFLAHEEALMAESSAAADEAVSRTKTLVWGAAGIALLFAAWAAWVVTRSVTRPVQSAVSALASLASGDLTQQVTVDRRDELGALLAGVNRSTAQLRELVSAVRSGVDSVSTASGQIAAGNSDLSSRTEQQASALQQTAASVEQITGTVVQSAENARRADELAQQASAAAAQGGQAVQRVVDTMDTIAGTSKRVADIISVIDGIAFQTNILALNAAVEAARAGEQGRGFAVVAAEVRGLAQRSAAAAREIKTLITQSVEQVEAGAQHVAGAGQVIGDVVDQVRKVTSLIGEISQAAREQSAGIGQVNAAVAHMDQATQQNAALVEESAAAAQSLSSQANQLLEQVAAFRV